MEVTDGGKQGLSFGASGEGTHVASQLDLWGLTCPVERTHT